MSNHLSEAQVNLFQDAYHPQPIQTLPLADVMRWLRDGRYRSDVREVRQVLANAGELAYRRAKNMLHAISFAGTFAPSRKNESLQQHSGIVHGDLDHLRDLADCKRAIAGDPRTVYVFTSPRGDGLKVGVHIPIVPDDQAYKHAWYVISAEYAHRYGGEWDPSGKDIARLCYVSYDPELSWNPHAEPFDIPPLPEPPQPTPEPRPRVSFDTPQADAYVSRAVKTAVQMIQSAQQGGRHDARLRAARLLGGYVGGGMLSEDQAYFILEQALSGYTDDLPAALKTVKDGLRYGAAKAFSLEALEAERQAWIAQHRTMPNYQPTRHAQTTNGDLMCDPGELRYLESQRRRYLKKHHIPEVDPWLGPLNKLHGIPMACQIIRKETSHGHD